MEAIVIILMIASVALQLSAKADLRKARKLQAAHERRLAMRTA